MVDFGIPATSLGALSDPSALHQFAFDARQALMQHIASDLQFRANAL